MNVRTSRCALTRTEGYNKIEMFSRQFRDASWIINNACLVLNNAYEYTAIIMKSA